jgi:CheY-like chemotaxis protein
MRNRPILIIDDDPQVCELVVDILARADFEVLSAPNGPEGIELARTAQPAVIILDMMMPEMDGLNTLKDLKRDPVLKDIPVVGITASTDLTYTEKVSRWSAVLSAEALPRREPAPRSGVGRGRGSASNPDASPPAPPTSAGRGRGPVFRSRGGRDNPASGGAHRQRQPRRAPALVARNAGPWDRSSSRIGTSRRPNYRQRDSHVGGLPTVRGREIPPWRPISRLYAKDRPLTVQKLPQSGGGNPASVKGTSPAPEHRANGGSG